MEHELPVWHLFGLIVNSDTVLTSWAVMALILIVGAVAARRIQQVPSSRQSLVEIVVDLAQGLVRDQIGPQTARYIGFIGSLFLFILLSNWLAILPWKILVIFGARDVLPPTSDVNTPAALALITVGSYFYYGISKKGLSYFKHYLQPVWVFLPLNILEDFSRPLALTFRLFGNVTAEHLVVGVLSLLVPLLIPLPMMALGLLTGAIQAYVFALLAASYIGGAVRDSH
ncbi:MAG TPA: ATP synthase F0 subunit A [Cyanobacteria bacterium UBA8530]|nr:ATP synthase F0 subunit A [Cyanobacteria bacterium UBA8530]